MTDFSNQVVWITGASSGIGEALAVAFAQAGARLVLSARRKGELERVAGRCGAAQVLVLPMDLAEPSGFEAATAEVLGRFGRLDVLVHNGGVSQRALVKDTVMEVHRTLMEVNYFGAVGLTRAVLPTFLAQRAGHFVVISSVAGKLGTPLRSAYCASKHALHGFFDCLRAEVSDAGVTVSLICPGYIHTDVSKNALTGTGVPTGTTGKDIAAGASPEATARQILAAVGAKSSEVYVGKLGLERVALTLKRLAPGLLERLVRNRTPQ